MDTLLIVVVALVVVGALVFFARRKKPELPAERHPPPPSQREQLAQPKDRPQEQPAPAPEPRPAETTTSEAAAPPAAAADSEEPAEPAAQPQGEPEAQPVPEPEPEPEPEEAVEEPPQPTAEELAAEAKAQDVAALRKGLANTRGGFIARLAKLFGSKGEVDDSLLEEVEEVLITADIGVKTADRILEELRRAMKDGKLSDADAVWTALRAQAAQILSVPVAPSPLDQQPALILVVGVNGVGKTTTIGKLASRYTAQGKKVLLAAGDTYRAAAVLQLEVWGKRVECPVVKGKEGADPGSVIFEAIKRAQDEHFDLVIADTAGRLHTKAPLMEELKKVARTAEKALGRAPDEVLLVLDSTTGQNAVQQMQLFKDAQPVSGVVLTKLDGTAKGGVILGIVDEHKIPVRYIGLGERVEDLREFDADNFVEALFAKPGDKTLAA